MSAATGPASAKSPGATYCYNAICHRVRTLDETRARLGFVEPLLASHYDDPDVDPFNPRLTTSSGVMFDAWATDNAASPIHPDGTILLVWSPLTGGAAVVRVNNAGPYYQGRTLDISRGLAVKLGVSHLGVMQLLTVVISAPNEAEARYASGRVYPWVRGYIGQHETLAQASLTDPRARQILFDDTKPRSALALVPRQPPRPRDQATLIGVDPNLRQALAGASPEVIDPDAWIEATYTLAVVFAETQSELVPPENLLLATPPAGTPASQRIRQASARGPGDAGARDIPDPLRPSLYE